MAGATTTYDIKLQYLMGGDAARGLDNLADKADRANRSSEGLKATLLGIGAAIGAEKLFHAGKDAFIGFNAEMQSLRISMGAMIQMNLGGTLEGAKVKANDLFQEFQRFSTVTPLTTKQIAEFGRSISSTVLGSGGNLKDFIDLTERGAVAAKVMGFEAGYAGVELSHLLMGDVSSRMLMAKNLFSYIERTHGISKETFKQLPQAQRTALVREALMNPGLKDATKDLGTSFEGVLSTFKDKLQIALGKVGLPLFERITKEIGSWNVWLYKNDRVLHDMGAKVGDALVKGFEMAKNAVKFLVDHKDEIMLIAKVWMAAKIGQIGTALVGDIKGAFAGPIGGIQNLFGALGFGKLGSETAAVRGEFSNLSKVMDNLPGSFGAFISQLGMAAAGLGLLYKVGEYVAEKVDQAHKQQVINEGERAGQFDVVNRLLRHGKAGEETSVFGFARRFGAVDEKTGVFNKQMFGEKLALLNRDIKGEDLNFLMRSAEAAILSIPLEKRLALLGVGAKPEEQKEDKPAIKKDKDLNVRIDKIEVASDDPDRFAFGLVRTFQDMVKNPVSAESALRGY